ncbi:MAG: hypothetical protein FWC64_07015 [Treponema sp.]|nr:hypothetical protein [Treponema sp.]
MELKKFRDGLVSYIASAFPAFSGKYQLPDHFITTDFLDFDKHKNSFQIFVDFDSVSFPDQPFTDDCSPAFDTTVNIWIVMRNKTINELDEYLLNAAGAMTDTVRACANYHKIKAEKIDFFKYTEGNANLVSARLQIRITAE